MSQLDENTIAEVKTFNGFRPSDAVSVIVLTYNRPNDLLHCLDALNRQTCRNFEIILADNHSDQLPDLSSYPVKLVKLKTNTGPGAGRNYGAAYSNAKLLIFLDDDSIPDPRLVEVYSNELLNRPDRYAARGRILPKHPSFYYDYFESVFDLGDKSHQAFLNAESNAAVRRSCFEAVGGWETGITCHEGLELSYRLIQKCGRDGMIYLPEAVVQHDTVQTLRAHLIRRMRFAATRKKLFAQIPGLAEFAETRPRAHIPPPPRNPFSRFRLYIIRRLTRIVTGPPSRARSFLIKLFRLEKT